MQRPSKKLQALRKTTSLARKLQAPQKNYSGTFRKNYGAPQNVAKTLPKRCTAPARTLASAPLKFRDFGCVFVVWCGCLQTRCAPRPAMPPRNPGATVREGTSPSPRKFGGPFVVVPASSRDLTQFVAPLTEAAPGLAHSDGKKLQKTTEPPLHSLLSSENAACSHHLRVPQF